MMLPATQVTRAVWRGLLALGVVATAGCNGDAPAGPRTVNASTLALELPAALGAPTRPPVEFDHGRHTAALEAEGCTACHPEDGQGGVVPKLGRTADPADAGALMDLYHARCLGCHDTRLAAGQATGPQSCPECHARRPAATWAGQALRFDYALHYRHSREADDTCGTCHHVYDQEQQKLVAREGTESACRDCHGDVDDGRTLSARNAAHTGCVRCHQTQQSGPVECQGCHDAKAITGLEQVKDVPRLMRGQPDKTWLRAEGAVSNVVPFDHAAHEAVTSRCSTCHHQTLNACQSCHPLAGGVEGGGVTLEQAYHSATSDHSCVGCHHTHASAKDCAGCHSQLEAPPSERGCTRCHSGPLPGELVLAAADGAATPTVGYVPAGVGTLGEATDEAGEGDAAIEDPSIAAPAAPPPTPFPEAPVLAPLPAVSEHFPDRLVLDRLAREYQPSKFPHAQIVRRLDKIARASKLAGPFHGRTETLCAGCHHNAPVGTRPAACVACHEATERPRADKPSLKTAYHLQCLGCHEAMDIPEQGCTDCHAEASSGEVQR